MVRTTITLPSALLEELVGELKAKSKTDAVITAVKDEIRIKKQERIKSMAGKMTFTASADDLRHRDKRIG